jgi:hypothetical protein
MNDSVPTYQHALVVSRLEKALDGINEANDYLEKRSDKIMAISTAAVAGAIGFGFLPRSVGSASTWDAGLIGAVVVLNLVLAVICSFLWGPQSRATPGDHDVDELTEHFIGESATTACENHIVDLAKAVRVSLGWNQSKGWAAFLMLWAVELQLVVLAIAVIVRLLSC